MYCDYNDHQIDLFIFGTAAAVFGRRSKWNP